MTDSSKLSSYKRLHFNSNADVGHSEENKELKKTHFLMKNLTLTNIISVKNVGR